MPFCPIFKSENNQEHIVGNNPVIIPIQSGSLEFPIKFFHCNDCKDVYAICENALYRDR